MVNFKLGERLKVQTVKMGINGEGIAYFKRRLIFVPYALPDEEVLIEITENQRNFSKARLINILKSSKYRVEPKDKAFYELSGSHIMHLAYPQQLAFKKEVLRDALAKYRPLGYEKYELRDTLGMPDWEHYRNKLQYQLRRLKSGTVIAGLYQENSHHLVNLEHCLVQEKETQKAVNLVCRLIEKYKLPVDDERAVKGLRTIMLRASHATGEMQMVLVSSCPIRLDGQTWPQNLDKRSGKNGFIKLDDLVSALTQTFPKLISIAVNYHPKKSSEIYGEQTQMIFGDKATITEQVLDYSFELSPRAFFQLNTKQAEVLYSEVVKALAPKKNDKIIDAYCGVGTIGFALANKVKSVHGMDIIPEAVEDARANAKRLGFKNCHYEIGKAEKVIPNMYKSNQQPTAIIVDPPRLGLDDALLETIVKYRPERLIYVSCNVSTLAKDLIPLSKFYQVEYIQSVDMFPQTARCEAVVKLTRK